MYVHLVDLNDTVMGSILKYMYLKKVELNATLSTSPILLNKTANIIKTKTGFSFFLL